MNKETIIDVIDNSDAQKVLCLHANNKKQKIKKSGLGNMVKVTIKKRIYVRNIIKKKINWAYICSTGKRIIRKSGITVKFNKTSCVIMSPTKKEMQGTTYAGTIPKELKKKMLEFAPYSKKFI